jgi:hypothetical protein
MMLLRPVALLAVFLIAAGCSGPTSAPSGGGGGPGQEVKADFKLKAVDLAKEYDADKAAADGKYKDKVVELDAEASMLTLRPGDVVMTVAQLPAPPGKVLGRMVMASFEGPEKDKLLALSKGQKIKVRAKVFGDFAGNVSLGNATILETGPDTAVTISAKDLAKEAVADEKAVEDKYKDKTLIVEGVVAELKGEEAGKASFVLEGFEDKGKKASVRAAYPKELAKEFDGLKKGDKVKVKGDFTSAVFGTIYLNDCRKAK